MTYDNWKTTNLDDERLGPEPEQSIACPRCGKTSHHPQDIAQRYCGFCHIFHDDEVTS